MDEKPFACKYCDKNFRRSEHLKVHERIHTGEKPYSCKHCQKRFIQAGDCKAHERIHTGEKPLPVNIVTRNSQTQAI